MVRPDSMTGIGFGRHSLEGMGIPAIAQQLEDLVQDARERFGDKGDTLDIFLRVLGDLQCDGCVFHREGGYGKEPDGLHHFGFALTGFGPRGQGLAYSTPKGIGVECIFDGGVCSITSTSGAIKCRLDGEEGRYLLSFSDGQGGQVYFGSWEELTEDFVSGIE